MEDGLTKKIEKFIMENKLIESGDRIVVGVSGGPDSICLLDILRKLKNKLHFEIYVAHVNHMLRANADLDEKYVENYCKMHNIPTFIKRANIEKISKDKKIGTEEAGRNVRYEFFKEIMDNVGANKVATAHNANDRAETVILNVIRGCGISGLTGIELKNKNIIRPLIETTRKDIEEYCNNNCLNPRIDESNMELIYQRNKVRNVMIPYIEKEFNENFVETINRLSYIAKEEREYIEVVVEEKYKEIVLKEEDKAIELSLKGFNKLEKVIKKEMIRYTINRVLGNLQGIGNIHIEDIIKLCEKEIGNKYLMPNPKVKICIKNKKIIITAN